MWGRNKWLLAGLFDSFTVKSLTTSHTWCQVVWCARTFRLKLTFFRQKKHLPSLPRGIWANSWLSSVRCPSNYSDGVKVIFINLLWYIPHLSRYYLWFHRCNINRCDIWCRKVFVWKSCCRKNFLVSVNTYWQTHVCDIKAHLVREADKLWQFTEDAQRNTASTGLNYDYSS